ncbi:MAG: family 10 glycosylhydrolase [Synechococcaceae cyanobacterium SM2_3_1]|nr:family 10 glycosylhydrolase [Synechococcaceae cyanobacterium SM2_3_1]
MPFNTVFLGQLCRSPGVAAGLSRLKKSGFRPPVLLSLLLIGFGCRGISVQAAPIFGVVRQELKSEQEWMTVRQQLNRSQVPFQSLEASDLDEDTLRDLQILFLPNPGRLQVEQVQALRNWLNADSSNQLILAGPLQVPANQEREMRQLLGAYWSRPLTTAAVVKLTNFESAAWADATTETGPVRGGELLPTGLDSRLIASWETGAGSSGYAVIATPQTVYLGWIWGENPDLDEQWLQAALQRVGERRESAPEMAALEEETGLEAFQRQPLSPLEALAMRQELLGLVGRIESAFLVTQATQGQSKAVPLGAEFQGILQRAEEVARQLPAWAERGESQRARQEFDAVLKDLWASYPVESLTTLPEVRAIWLDRGTIVEAGSERGLVQVFDRLAQAGINTVFFETINAGYPIYPSRVAPTQNPLTRGWDPLAAAVKLAHEREIELHSWIWTFAVGNQRHNVLPEMGLAEDYPGPVLSQYPQWANLDDRGGDVPTGAAPDLD